MLTKPTSWFQSFAVSNAAVHDSQVFEELLDPTLTLKVKSAGYMQTAHIVPKNAKRL